MMCAIFRARPQPRPQHALPRPASLPRARPLPGHRSPCRATTLEYPFIYVLHRREMDDSWLSSLFTEAETPNSAPMAVERVGTTFDLSNALQ